MKTLCRLAVLGVVAVAGLVSASGRWDGSFERVGQLVSVNPTSANLAIKSGSYVKVQCDKAAYVGSGFGSGAACTSSTCETKAAGDVYYSQLAPTENRVAMLCVTGTCTCQVFRARD